MKIYRCPRCGKKMEGRTDICPRCAQHIIYEVKGRYFDSMNNEYTYDLNTRKITLYKANPNAPKNPK